MGRPRDPELEQRLLAATWELVTTEGYESLSMARVATAANAHRTDVYRRWSTKTQLVTDALAAHLPAVSNMDTGTLRGDLRQYVDDLWASWSSPWIDPVVGLLAELARDPEAEAAFLTMSKRRTYPVRDAIVRAVRRGEVTDVPDLPLLGDLLEGPIMHRRMIGRQVMTPDDLDAVVDAAYRLFTVTAPTP